MRVLTEKDRAMLQLSASGAARAVRDLADRGGGRVMARTERRNYRDEWGRESRHWWGKRCPEPNCPACHTGREKRTWNRWWRRQWRGKEDQ